jgi:hypothetical protein
MNIKIGKYQHYKGKLYQVTGIAIHSETLEEMVIYQALYDDVKFGKNAVWVRPAKMFIEQVIYHGEKVARFNYIGE